MEHKATAFEDQTVNPAIDRNDPGSAASAVELRFPETFSKTARNVIRYFEGAMYLYQYKGQYVVTDESLELTEYGDGSREAPFGAPRWTGDSLNELESWLEAIAADYDEDGNIPGWDQEDAHDSD